MLAASFDLRKLGSREIRGAWRIYGKLVCLDDSAISVSLQCCFFPSNPHSYLGPRSVESLVGSRLGGAHLNL